jgi:acyl-CoA thioester hydrolase
MPEDVHARVEAMAKVHAALPRPDGIGRKIGIRRKG